MEVAIPSFVRWQDAVDIILTSYILFRIYVLFKGTNVLRVVAAFALFWIIQRVATNLGLIVTSWAFNGIITVAALIIVIVFRNEIRSVLQTNNIKALLWGLHYQGPQKPLETITNSVMDLAQRRIGALIVIPGKEDINDITRSGVPWDGQLSREMMLSIFWPDNPVHDGAAIIENDRVIRVGAILPLSQRHDLPTHLGTRHRAAAGLAEQTDSVAIVVSEETGQVTIVKHNRFTPIKTAKALSKILTRHMGGVEKNLLVRWRSVLEYVAAALVSVLLIAGIWTSFSQGRGTLVTLKVPIEFVGQNPRMELISSSSDSVSIQLGGSAALLKSIRPEQVTAKINLSHAAQGKNTFTLSGDNITLPPGAFLKDVNPRLVETILDVPVEVELPIQADWIGVLPTGIRIVEVKIEPSHIRVVGPSRLVATVDTLYTEKIPVDDINDSGKTVSEIILSPVTLNTAPGQKTKVVVSYRVEKQTRVPTDAAGIQ